MKKRTIIISAVILIILCIGAFLLYQKFAPRTYSGEKNVSVTVIHGDKTEKTFTYKGKTYTPYDATQYMRKLERDMRKLKRNMIGYQAMGGAEGEEAFENAAIKLQMKSRAYHSFSKVSKLKKRQSSAQVYGFDRSLAAKAKKYYKK